MTDFGDVDLGSPFEVTYTDARDARDWLDTECRLDATVGLKIGISKENFYF